MLFDVAAYPAIDLPWDLIWLNNLSKSYGPHMIFDEANLVVNDNQKIAVLGWNGAGKSTLFKIIISEESFEDGQNNVHERTRIGYLTQHAEYSDEETVIEYLMRSSGKEDWECGKIAGQFQLKNKFSPFICFLLTFFNLQILVRWERKL